MLGVLGEHGRETRLRNSCQDEVQSFAKPCTVHSLRLSILAVFIIFAIRNLSVAAAATVFVLVNDRRP